MRVKEEYKKTGFFWLPEKEEEKIPGILTINDGGEIELEVVGLFDDSIEALNSDGNLDRIIGHIEKDGLVTLEDCLYLERNFAFGAIAKSKVLVRQVLSGAAWGKDEKVTFNTLSFSVDCLDDWVGISGMTVDNDWNKKITTISYKPPETISFPLENGMNLKLCFSYTVPCSSELEEGKITQRAYFKISSKSLCELSESTDLAFKITNLMCFAMDETVSIKALTATSPEIMRDVGGKQRPESIKIYYQSMPYIEKEPSVNRHNMLFNFGTIKSNAKKIFDNWINAYGDLSPALGLYFSAKTGAQRYLDSKFLALAQGLETYHRRTSSETLMQPEEFRVLVDSILDFCPKDKKEWLKSRLIHGNEINLGGRLKKIIEPFKQHIGTSRERSKLLRKIVDTRNYLTHYNDELEGRAANDRELWILCVKMELIFSLHFLRVIGLTGDEIEDVMKNCQPLKQKINIV